MATNFFFDAHFHPTLKKQFAKSQNQDDPDSLSNPWKTAIPADFLMALSAIPRCLLKPLVEHSLASQSSLSQLTDNNFKLGVAALFFPDRGLIQLITKTRGLMKLIKNDKFGALLDKDQFNKLKDKKDAFETVLNDLLLLEKKNHLGQTIGLLRGGTFDPQPADLPQLVFSVEGLHCLRTDLDEQDSAKIPKDILENLDKLLAREIRIAFINLVHIDSSNELFANQAYAVDAFRVGGFEEQHLRPTGNGLTEAGKQITQELNSREILVDVKHMGWLARKQFYEFNAQQNDPKPIVCSHTGFTGCWFNNPGGQFSDYILELLLLDGRHGIRLNKANPYLDDNLIGFNVSTINLFNEDIRAIIQSDGLIGISLDQRVLGFSEIVDTQTANNEPGPEETNVVRIADGPIGELTLLTDMDFISSAEFQKEAQFQKLSQKPAIRKQGVFAMKKRVNIANLHARHFYLHIVHAMQVARMIGHEEATRTMLTRTLCIGSDFDGLIDGLDCCPDMGHIGALKQKFINEFGNFLNEIKPIKITLPDGLSVEQVADRIFYENGRDFVLRRLEAMNSNPTQPDEVII